MTIWRWADYFCDIPDEHRITLGEGETPLIRSRTVGPTSGLNNLYFKLETANPTGSYKDRYAAVAISDMLTHGKTRSVGTSSGNTGSAIAAYCAAAQIACEIAIVETAPEGKLKQMLAYGAQLYKVKGMGSDAAASQRAVEVLKQKADRPDAKLQISAFQLSPAGMAGVQTIGYELAEQLYGSPFEVSEQSDVHVFVPAGGGGLTLAIARGFADLVERSELATSPAVHCVQPAGNDTMAGPLRDGAERGKACESTTKISGLQVANVIDGNEVIPACRASGGTGHLVEDESTWDAQRRLAREEGVFCEPAGAIAVAAALEAARRGDVQPNDHVVAVITGIGFKDPPSVDRMVCDAECPTIEVSEILVFPTKSGQLNGVIRSG